MTTHPFLTRFALAIGVWTLVAPLAAAEDEAPDSAVPKLAAPKTRFDRNGQRQDSLATNVVETNSADGPIVTTQFETRADAPLDAGSIESPALPAEAERTLDFVDETPRFRRHDPRVGVRHDTGAGVGYEDSFWTFEGIMPLFEMPGESLTFFDGRFLLSNSAAIGSNVGVAHRFVNSGGGRIFGGYGFYDYRDTGRRAYSQLSLGFESLGEVWDFRTNGYIPIGSTRKPVSGFYSPFIRGTSLLLLQDMEEAMPGFDFEAGRPLWRRGNFVLMGFVGGYHFQADGSPDAWGARGRLTADATRNLALEFSLSNDTVFGTSAVFSAAFRLNNLRRRARGPDETGTIFDRISEPIVRASNVNIVNEIAEVPATNPIDGRVIRVFSVNNMSVDGDGSPERPFGTLAQAAAAAGTGDIFLVHAGDGTTKGLDQGIALQDYQKLFGTSAAATFVSAQGVFALPGYEIGPAATLSSPGPVVTLANNTEVAGLSIQAVGGPAIQGEGIEHAFIHDNDIKLANGADGIRVANITGIASVTSNKITGSGGAGITLAPGRNLTVDVQSNSVSGTTSGGIVINPVDGSNLNATVNKNIVQGNAGSGFVVTAQGVSSTTIVGFDNHFSGNGGDGVRVNTLNESVLITSIRRGVLSNNGGAGFASTSSGTSSFSLDMSENAFDFNTAGGVTIQGFENGKVAGLIGSSVFTSNGNAGINVSAANQSVVLVSGGAVYMNQAGAKGANIVARDNSQASLGLATSIIEGGDVGIDAATHQSAHVELAFSEFQVKGQQSSALRVETFDQSKINASIIQGVFTGNNASIAGSGLDIRSQDSSTLGLILAQSSSDTGFNLFATPASVFKIEDWFSTNTGTVTQFGVLTVIPQGTLLDEQ